MRPTLYFLVTAALLSAQTPLGTGPNFYSRDKEAALGAQLAQQIRQTSTPVDNAAALGYVQQIGTKLAAQLPEPRFPYTFALIADRDGQASAEPMSLPGGYIFVPTSLLLNAQDDAEFAGLLAHAMAHVAARDGTRLATQTQLAQLSTMPLIFYGGWTRYGVTQTTSLLPLAVARTSQRYEQQADVLAVGMLAGAGYNPQGLIRSLTRQQAATPANREFLQTRIATIEAAIQALPHAPSNDLREIQNGLRGPARN